MLLTFNTDINLIFFLACQYLFKKEGTGLGYKSFPVEKHSTGLPSCGCVKT